MYKELSQLNNKKTKHPPTPPKKKKCKILNGLFAKEDILKTYEMMLCFTSN